MFSSCRLPSITPFSAPPHTRCLQGRLADSNRNLAAKALSVVGDIAKAMGPPFDKQARGVLLGPALANLSDNKKQVGRGRAGMGRWCRVSAYLVSTFVAAGAERVQGAMQGYTGCCRFCRSRSMTAQGGAAAGRPCALTPTPL